MAKSKEPQAPPRSETPAEREARRQTFIATVINWETQLDLVKSMVARNCTNQEFALLCHIAKKYALDPLAGEIRAMKFKRKNKETGEKEWAPASIDISRDGYISIAHRSKCFDGMISGIKDAKIGLAYCKVWRKDMSHPFYVEAYFDDYYDPYNPKWWDYKNSKRGNSWRLMLVKCAEHACLRRAFSIHGAYSEDEIGAIADHQKIEYVEDPDIPLMEPEVATDQESEPLEQEEAAPAEEEPAPPADPEPAPASSDPGPAADPEPAAAPESEKKPCTVPVKLDTYKKKTWFINEDYIVDFIGCINSTIKKVGRHVTNEALAKYGVTIKTLNTISEVNATSLLKSFKIEYKPAMEEQNDPDDEAPVWSEEFSIQADTADAENADAVAEPGDPKEKPGETGPETERFGPKTEEGKKQLAFVKKKLGILADRINPTAGEVEREVHISAFIKTAIELEIEALDQLDLLPFHRIDILEKKLDKKLAEMSKQQKA